MHAQLPLQVGRSTSKIHKNYQYFYRAFHDYFVTHLPSSSLHPDSRSASGPHHQLPRSASKPHNPREGPSPAPLLGGTRDTTVVRIPLRNAKHHFGVSVSRGSRPYNEDTYQAGVIEIPAFAKRAPRNLTRAPASSPLQAYREKQKKEQDKGTGDGEGTSAESASGDPQVFYFGIFDGHGGTECSGYLREKLHESIEEAAGKYGLESTLNEMANGVRAGVNTVVGPSQKKSQDSADRVTGTECSGSDPSEANKLQTALIKSWKETVGGYFRRFQPAAFSSDSKTTIATILTHAFLQTDLAFLLAQLRLSSDDNDSVASDRPLNANDNLHSPAHPPSPSQHKKPFKGGSTASIALISTPTPTPFWHPSTPSTLYTAHCGDTRILLSRVSNGQAVPLTTDHHPSAPSESQRLRRWAASFVTDSFGEERMSGLANTRAFGDMGSKRMGVSAEPEICHLELAPSEYAFMVLVSDGVSGGVGDQEIVDLVKEAKTPELGAREVVSFATEVGSDGDNATALVVRLGGWERRSEGGGGSLGTKESREWRRKEAMDPRGKRTLL
ncbi:phosphatase 2C-like domain-containing protein [Usnea florida]